MTAGNRQDGSSWWDAAFQWWKAWIVTSAALVVVAVAAAPLQAWLVPPSEPDPSPLMGSVGTFHVIVAMILFAEKAIGIALGSLVALPLQVTALRLRTREASAPVFAAVAGLTTAAAVVSFLAFYALARSFFLLFCSSAVLTVALLGCYALHVVILVVARRMAAPI